MCRLRAAAAPLGLLLLALAQPGCAAPGPEIAFTVDLRRSAEGVVAIRMRARNPGAGPLTLSSFAQPEAVRVESLRARSGGGEIPAEPASDAAGFQTWSLGPAPGADEIIVEYGVRPGAVETAGMSGPTGFRLGVLDGRLGLFGARQVFLLPTEPRFPGRITVRFIPPPDQEVITTWPEPRGTLAFSFEGSGSARRLLDAVIAVGRVETRRSADGRFEVSVPAEQPEEIRADTTRRALALEDYLAARLGAPAGPYRLILVPRGQDGFSVPAMSAPGGLGMSLGPGVPTRWLTIGRAIGQAYLARRIEALPATDPGRRILEALPTWLTVRFSERDGWRSRRDWYEGFYSETVDLDLRDPLAEVETTRLEWRTTVALELLSGALERGGHRTLERMVADALGRGGRLDWGRLVAKDLPEDVRAPLDRWLSPAPDPFPLPGQDDAAPARVLRPPPAIRPASGRSGRIDLYFGARNLGLLEQCGCKKEQWGGMARRATVLRRRLAAGGPALALEIGDALPWDHDSPVLDPQKIAESDLVLSLLAEAGVRATVVGHAEVSYGPGFLADRIARLPRGFTMLSANVSGPGLAPPPLLGVVGTSLRTTIVGLMDPTAYDLGRALEFEDAIAGLSIAAPARAAADLRDRLRSGLTVVAGPLGPRAVLEIQAAVPGLRLIVTSGYFRFLRLPLLRFERPIDMATFGMLDGTLVVLLKSDAKGLVRLGLGLDRDGRITGAEIEGIPLNDAVPDDPGVRRRLDAHYARLAAASGMPDRPPIGDPLRLRLQADYVGSEGCATCHPGETRQWQGTAHATAFTTLLARHRQGVPGCYACHVTGYRQPSGYRSISDTGLRHVQCESCHGPGSRHVTGAGADAIVRVPPAAVCRECHTQEHSDMTEENFGDYWARIVHSAGEREATGHEGGT